MRDAFRGRGRGRGGGGWRGAQRAAVAESHHQQQWKSGPGLVSGLDTRHYNPREPRARPEREAEPPHGSVLPTHPPPPHRRRQQGQGFRKERTAPYEPRAVLGPHGAAAPVPVVGGGQQVVMGGRGVEGAVVGGGGGPIPHCSAPLGACMPPPTVCCSIYADQLIDYYTGKICPRRFCVAYNEVCKLVRLPEAPPAPAGAVLQPLSPGGGARGVRSDDGVQEMQVPNGPQRSQAVALEADEMSEVSQVEEGEVDEEAPAVQLTQHTSQGGQQQQQRSASAVPGLQGSAAVSGSSACPAAAPQPPAGIDASQLQKQGVVAPTPAMQQQQPMAAPNTARRDPRLAARARAETGVQQQHQEVVQNVQQPENSEPPQQSQQEMQEPQETRQQQYQQKQAKQWDPSALPAELRRQPLLSGKLPLLLDLDNTLLHAQAVGVAGYTIALEDWLDEDGLPEVYKFELPCNRKVYYLKLRPGLRRFLKALAPVFELSIYTNATQEYADLVVAILDPDRSLFGDR